MTLRGWLPPLAAWLAGAALLCAAAGATGHDPFRASTWARSDSGLYQQIARHGYELHRCAPGEAPRAGARWCGDTAWFPAYPLAIAAVAAVGIPLTAGAVAVSWLAAGATLVLLWRWFLPRRLGPLACAAFAPGVVYLYAVYPLSLLALAGVVFLRHLDRNRVLAGLAGGVAALAYPLAVVLVPVVAVVQLWPHRRSPGLLRRANVLAGPALLAVVGLVVVQRVQTGRWTAYLDVAHNYRGLHDPLETVSDWFTVLWRSSNPLGYSLVPIWQLLFVTVLLAACLIVAARRDAALVAWCVAAWFVPLLQTRQSLWRSEAALVLLAPLVARLPARLVGPAAAALAVLAFGVAHEFFAGTLL